MFDFLKNVTYQIISPIASARSRYETFKDLLKNDQKAHELLATLEEVYYQNKKVDINYATRLYSQLSQAVSTMVACLGKMSPGESTNLRAYYRKIDFFCRFALAPPEIDTSPPFILPITKIYPDDSLTGGKGFNFCILKNTLGLPGPHGFIISTSAYNYFIKESGLRHTIDEILAEIDIHSTESLHNSSKQIIDLIGNTALPDSLKKELNQAFKELRNQCSTDITLAVRSSAVGEDSKISFAGQYLSILDADGGNLLESYKQVTASKFSPRALYYRISNGLHDYSTAMAVLVLEMVDASVSGVITTKDSFDKGDDVVCIHSLQGRGEDLVSGKRSPDTTIIQKEKPFKILQQIPSRPGDAFTLTEDQAKQLAQWAIRIESHYGVPQEIEWCIDQNGSPLILQTRFLRVQKKPEQTEIDTSSYRELFRGGELAARGSAAGKIYLLNDFNRLSEVPKGAILVTRSTLPSLATIAHNLAGVIADAGSAADHFASVAREFNIPTLVKTNIGTELFTSGQQVTLWTDQTTVFDGVVETLITQYSEDEKEKETPFLKSMSIVISLISPLRMVNPADPSFVPESCRSLHDIIRFVHEKGMMSMFGLALHKPLRKGGSKLLESNIPLQLYLLNVGGGLSPESDSQKTIAIEDVLCRPLLALWKGLAHTGVTWQDRSHFDWGAYDDLVMAGGVVNAKSIAFASYAVISQDYLNLNMRFGYHFAILDALCSPDNGEGYITLRFAGGGGDIEGKLLRLAMISEILSRLNFTVTRKSDLLDARFSDRNTDKILETLDMLGRLLGATRIMDMILTNEEMAAGAVEEFMNGKYTFSKE
ncbi:MAG: hypothetical protein H8E41_02070 [Desulfobulbaceae bacterium]|uniref:Phosphoenolpyruvate synthase n=1 Tax=Candidatus Desulfobia pelagia TaxID=2841692 RepID=A0A8J6NBD5_9BACT|nr:hypothetical protein [Candidatus Desulfobia pelagia]